MLSFQLTAKFNTDLQALYQHFVNPSLIAEWAVGSHQRLREMHVNLRAGGNFRCIVEDELNLQTRIIGDILVVEPFEQITLTWHEQDHNHAVKLDLVFGEINDTAVLGLTHAGSGQAEMMKDHERFWTLALERLSLVLRRSAESPSVAMRSGESRRCGQRACS